MAIGTLDETAPLTMPDMLYKVVFGEALPPPPPPPQLTKSKIMERDVIDLMIFRMPLVFIDKPP
jgi:hypothetical protein